MIRSLIGRKVCSNFLRSRGKDSNHMPSRGVFSLDQIIGFHCCMVGDFSIPLFCSDKLGQCKFTIEFFMILLKSFI